MLQRGGEWERGRTLICCEIASAVRASRGMCVKIVGGKRVPSSVTTCSSIIMICREGSVAGSMGRLDGRVRWKGSMEGLDGRVRWNTFRQCFALSWRRPRPSAADRTSSRLVPVGLVHIVTAYIVMAYMVSISSCWTGAYSYGLYSHGLHGLD